VGTVGAGRIGLRVLRRLGGFGCRQLLYNDYTWLPEEREAELGVQVGDMGGPWPRLSIAARRLAADRCWLARPAPTYGSVYSPPASAILPCAAVRPPG
jgi:hypothetical protein